MNKKLDFGRGACYAGGMTKKNELFSKSLARLESDIAAERLKEPDLYEWPAVTPKEIYPAFRRFFDAAYEAGKRAGYDEELKDCGYAGLEQSE